MAEAMSVETYGVSRNGGAHLNAGLSGIPQN